jgi:hypothetical protein
VERGDAYRLVLNTPDGKNKAFELVSMKDGVEATFFDAAGKLNMTLSTRHGDAAIDLFDAGRQVVHLCGESSSGHLGLFKVAPTAINGESGYSVQTTVSLPE